MKPIIVFLHIPKTAGTTLIERYWHNKNFCAVDRTGLTDNPDVIFGHTTDIGKYESIYGRECVYVTSLRDPISRLMSQYNFVRSQINYMNPNTEHDLDFYTWFINKDIMRPMIFLKQYEFLNRKINVFDRREEEYMLMYRNQILTWDGKKTTIDQNRYSELSKRQSQIEKENAQYCLQHVMPQVKHRLFTNQDVITSFESLLEEYNISFDSVRDIKLTNDTRQTLNFQGREYIRWDDLSQESKLIVEHEMQAEMEFYDACQS